jgi:hypothetical protein
VSASALNAIAWLYSSGAIVLGVLIYWKTRRPPGARSRVGSAYWELMFGALWPLTIPLLLVATFGDRL